MSEKKVKICELFDCRNEYIAPLFAECEYPWQVLPKIRPYIEKLTAEELRGFREISQGVFVGENVRIHPNVTIEPPAIIGEGCELRTGAFLRGNVIVGRGCVIGNSSELKNCVLLDGVQVPHYNYVGDSLLGNRAHLGAGSICSNLKADKSNVVIHGDEEYETGIKKVGAMLGDGADVGCGCVLNPGTVIGKGTSVYPLNSLRGVFPGGCIVKNCQTVKKRR